MIYTGLTKKALVISFNAHKEQVDKSGMPYVYHPYEVASHMDDEYSTCTALLHDVVEDTEITLDDLRKEGFPEEVIEALSLMTHADGVPYDDYIKALKTNPIAVKVKLADLTHNSNPDRLETIDERMLQRFEKYKRAKEFLLGKNEL
ncbi:MAG: bifunctional (p)ppGpp synthetase/guanosine-3',5'-bis(diphosphate) 3'-pyrophosphohydrolase [Clostridia bacterium]|nr:bifunctional (p)ppGpp synthetase/guanosine-3',5'-bis(diphosphate) 3'-pyrophosphohydrolase [Clostridia bacterium]